MAAEPFFSFVVAMTEKRVIGRDNRLPWNLPVDLKRFRDLTNGHTIIMGRKTFESIGRVLPNRRHIVITRQKDWVAPPGVEVVSDLHALLKNPPAPGENFIIGGGEIFREAAPYAKKLYITWILEDIPGDAYYPETDFSRFDAHVVAEGREPIPYRFVDYTRRG